MKNSKLKMAATPNTSSSGCCLRRARMFGNELRASAAGRLRPARPLQGRILLFGVFGPRLAKRTQERTCGTRTAGLRGARLRPAAVPFGTANSKFRIQDSKLRGLSGYAWAYISGRVAACGARRFGNELRASAAERLRPADPCGIDFVLTSQQLPVKVAMLPAKSVAERPAARSRPRAEGCSLWSQARPLGCGLAAGCNRSVRTERAGASRRRRPASRVPKVRSSVLSAGCSPSLILNHEFAASQEAAAARSRLRAEGCSFASQAHRSAAGLSSGSTSQRSAGRSLGAAEARSSLPNVRDLRRLRPELESNAPFLILNLES